MLMIETDTNYYEECVEIEREPAVLNLKAHHGGRLARLVCCRLINADLLYRDLRKKMDDGDAAHYL